MKETPSDPDAASFRSAGNGEVSVSAEAQNVRTPQLVFDNMLGWRELTEVAEPARQASQEQSGYTQ